MHISQYEKTNSNLLPVETDETEIHDGRGTEHHVHCRVHVAPQRPEHPVAQQLNKQSTVSLIIYL